MENEKLDIPPYKPVSYSLNNDVISIYNFRQAAFYWLNGLAPLDIYSSRHYATDEPIIIFVFRRSDTKKSGIMDAWNEHSKNGTIKFKCTVQKFPKSENIVWIVNFKQAKFYCANGLEALEIRPSIDKRTSEPIIAFAFDRLETQTSGVYDAWCKNNQTLE